MATPTHRTYFAAARFAARAAIGRPPGFFSPAALFFAASDAVRWAVLRFRSTAARAFSPLIRDMGHNLSF
jgi:hypothetical protein